MYLSVQLPRIIVILAATEKIVPFGRLHYRMLLRLCSFHLSNKIKHFQKVKHPLSSTVQKDMLWWIDPANVLKGVSMNRSAPSVHTHPDGCLDDRLGASTVTVKVKF